MNLLIVHRNMSILLFVALLCLPMMSVAKDTEEKCTGIQDMFPCHLEIISWVNVDLDSDLLKQYKSDFEKLIRLRLRNDLSMMSHETRTFQQVLKDNKYNFNNPRIKKRGHVNCFVWTVGKKYPVAIYTECTLSGWGDYKYPTWDKFESRMLGYSSSDKARKHVKDSIREIITTISAEFLERRDFVRGLGKKKPQSQ